MKELLCLTFISIFLTLGTLPPTTATTVAANPVVHTTTGAPVSNAATAAPVTNATTAAPVPVTNATTAAPVPVTNATTAAPVPVTNATTATPVPVTNATTAAPVPVTNATTAAPVTNATTVAPKTSTVPPTPPSSPSTPVLDTYIVSDSINGTNVTCLVMKAEIKFEIPYVSTTKKNLNHDGVIGKSPHYHGTCAADIDRLIITTNGVTLDLTFKNNGKQYSLSDLKLTANTTYFKDGKGEVIVSNYTNEKAFQLNVGDYYSCNSATTLHLSSKVNVTLSNLKMEAFRNSNTTEIAGKMVICPGDQKTNSIVPIAVGAALAGLVVVVLIAYLIGRKRSRRGYESV